ncbi:MAG: hypothetical protein IJR53_04245 [Bacteroidales bacterium]|nr:hypothetical protein [Bacteroidales bacterium]
MRYGCQNSHISFYNKRSVFFHIPKNEDEKSIISHFLSRGIYFLRIGSLHGKFVKM